MAKVGTAWVEIDGDLSPLNRKLNELRAKDAKVDVEADVDRASFARARAEADRTTKSTDKLGFSTARTNRNFQFFRNTMGLLKWPALIAGAGQAAAALGAAGGGAVALTGALAPGVGLLTQYGTLLGTIGQVGAVKALSGLTDVSSAVGGINQKIDKQSVYWKRLSPQAQKFAETLDRLQSGPLAKLQARVQRPLFRGLTDGIQSARKNLPALNHVLTGTSKVLGDVTRRFGDFLGSKGFGSDFKKIGDTNNLVLERMGKAGVNVAHILTDIMVAARPLTEWLSKMALGWTDNLKGVVQNAREGGKLTHFFHETQQVTSRVVSILGSMGKALWNIISLGKPLGDSILKSLDKSAKDFAAWTESASGQNKIANYFKAIKPPLFEMGRLVRDIVKDFVSLSDPKNSGLTNILHELRTGLLPVLVSVVHSTSQAFGPTFVDLLTHVAEIIGKLAGSSGPLTLYVDLLDRAAIVVNKILDVVPGLQSGIVTLLGFAGVLKAIKFTGAITGISTLVGWFGKLTAAETAAAEVNVGQGILANVSGTGVRSKLEGFATHIRSALGFFGPFIALGVGAAVVGALGGAFDKAIHKFKPGQHLARVLAQDAEAAARHERVAVKVANQVASDYARAQRRKRDATDAVHRAERKLHEDEKRFGKDSHQVAEDARKVAKAREHEARATKAVTRAQRADADVQKALADTLTHTAAKQRAALRVANQQHQAALNQLHDDEKAHAHHKVIAADLADVQSSGKLARKAQDGLNKTLADAANKVSPKYQQAIKGDSKQLAHHRLLVQQTADVLHNQLVDKMNEATLTLRGSQSAAAKYQDRLDSVKDRAKLLVSQGLSPLQQKTEKTTDSVRKSAKTLRDPMQTELDHTASKAKKTGDAFDPAAKNVNKKTRQMAGNALDLSDAVGAGLDAIGFNLNDVLQSLGVKKLNFSIKKAAKAAGSFFGSLGLQSGGAIVPGVGPGDKVPLHMAGQLVAMVEPGELVSVTNRNATAALMSVNDNIKRLAGGGGVNFDGHPSNVAPALRKLIGIMEGQFPGLSVTATTDGSHVSGSDHYTGHAVDLASSDFGYMDRAAGWVRSSGLYRKLKQGIHNPNLAVNAGQVVPDSFFSSVWADHRDHIHLAVYDALSGKFGPEAQQLARVILQGPKGPLKTAGQAALDKVRKAANTYIAKHTPMETGGAGISADGDVERVFAKTAKQLSTSKTATLALGEAGFAESGMRDLPGGDSSSEGALQLLASTASGMGIDPHNEGQVASAFLLRGFYGKGGANKLAAQGLPAYLVAQNVQGSAFSSGSNYADQEGPAKDWMRRFGLKRGGLVKMLRDGGMAGPPGGTGGSRGHRGHPHGLIPAGLLKKTKHHRKHLKRFLKGVKAEGLDPDLAKRIRSTQTDVETFSDYADRADSLNSEDPAGNLLLGDFRGQTELGWLGDEIEALRKLRNLLIRGEQQINAQRDLIAKQLKKAKEKLKNWQKRQRETDPRHHGSQAYKLAKDIGAIHDELSGKSGKKLSKERRRHLHDRLESLTKKAARYGDQHQRASFSVKTLDERIIPALKTQEKADKTKIGGLETSLIEVEGRIPDPLAHRPIKAFLAPYDFRFSGQIFDAMTSLRDLQGSLKPPTPETLDIPGLIEFAKLVQIGAFKTDAFGTLPKFHEGGVLGGGPEGAERPYLGKVGEGIFTPDQMRALAPVSQSQGPDGDLAIYADFYIDGEPVRGMVRGEIRKVERRKERESSAQERVGARYPAA